MESKLKRVFASFRAQIGVGSRLRYTFEGETLFPEQNAMDIDMYDGDEIIASLMTPLSKAVCGLESMEY